MSVIFSTADLLDNGSSSFSTSLISPKPLIGIWIRHSFLEPLVCRTGYRVLTNWFEIIVFSDTGECGFLSSCTEKSWGWWGTSCWRVLHCRVDCHSQYPNQIQWSHEESNVRGKIFKILSAFIPILVGVWFIVSVF